MLGIGLVLVACTTAPAPVVDPVAVAEARPQDPGAQWRVPALPPPPAGEGSLAIGAGRIVDAEAPERFDEPAPVPSGRP